MIVIKSYFTKHITALLAVRKSTTSKKAIFICKMDDEFQIKKCADAFDNAKK